MDPVTRAGLASAMLKDVLRALARARTPERVIVFTAADEVLELVQSFGFETIKEESVLMIELGNTSLQGLRNSQPVFLLYSKGPN